MDVWWDNLVHEVNMYTAPHLDSLFGIGFAEDQRRATTVLLVGTIVVVLLLFVAVFTRSQRMAGALRSVPRVGGWQVPFLGDALKLTGPRPWERMRQWSIRHGGGRIVQFKILDKHVVFVAHPPLLRRVLLSEQRNYKKDLPSFKHFMCLLGSGLVTSEDAKWRKGRLLLSHAMRIDVLDSIPAVGVQAAEGLIEQVLMATASQTRFDLDEAYRHLTLQVIGQAVLSLPADIVTDVFPSLYLPVVQEANRRVWAPWRQFMPWLRGCRERSKALKRLNEYLAEYVRKRWLEIQQQRTEAADQPKKTTSSTPPPTTTSSRKKKEDILDRYMTQLETCDEVNVRQVRDDLKTMILAGHETSAATLTWATFEAIQHPEVMRELVAEHDRVFGRASFGSPDFKIPTADELRKELKWAPAVLRETLRLHSVVPLVMRVATKDDEVPASETGLGRPITIPKGCTVMVSIAGVHARPDLWPEPEQFRPERFFDMDAIDPYAWIPFINGPRNCLGQHLSLLEMQIVLLLLVGRVELRLEMPAEVAGRPHNNVIPVIPAEGLVVSGTRRS